MAARSDISEEVERLNTAFHRMISRLETNPPAGLYRAPASRQKSVVKNPETLKKLMI